MKVMVTGATGLIGNRLVGVLQSEGHQVVALVRDPERARGILHEEVALRRGDVTDRDSVAAALDGCELVFHAAGMPEQWQKDPQVFDRVNCGGTRYVLEAALAAGVKRVVYTSTLDVFAAEPNGTVVETRLDPNPKPTAYERSKQAADREAERIRERGLDLVHVCPGAVYGPSPVHIGLNSFFIKLLNRASPMLPPGGLSYLYVDNCARAHRAAALAGVSGERYLIADGHADNRELAREILARSDLRRVPPVAPLWLLKGIAIGGEAIARHFDVNPLVALGQLSFMQWNVRVDTRKAQRELGFVPVALADGVAQTVASLRKQGLVP
jgi:nucleoside-diphosphate-sugar epimerase